MDFKVFVQSFVGLMMVICCNATTAVAEAGYDYEYHEPPPHPHPYTPNPDRGQARLLHAIARQDLTSTSAAMSLGGLGVLTGIAGVRISQ